MIPTADLANSFLGGSSALAHRYWRLMDIQAGGPLELSELQIYENGVDITSAATKTSATPPDSGTFADLFDGNIAVNGPNFTNAAVEDPGFYFLFDFGGGQKRIVDGVKQAGGDNAIRYLTHFTLQTSDNGVAWHTIGQKADLNYPGNHTLSQEYHFGPPTQGGHRYWRINALDISGAFFEVQEIRVFEDAVDITEGLGKFSSSAPDVGGALLDLFDELSDRAIWSAAVAEGGGFYIKFDAGINGRININGVKQQGHDTSGRHMSGFTLQYSDDDSSWTTVGSKSGLSYPGNGTLSSLYTFP